jgi:hypothetical protein
MSVGEMLHLQRLISSQLSHRYRPRDRDLFVMNTDRCACSCALTVTSKTPSTNIGKLD